MISTCQNESNGMFGFQNRVPEAKKPKLQAKRYNSAYLKKYVFQP